MLCIRLLFESATKSRNPDDLNKEIRATLSNMFPTDMHVDEISFRPKAQPDYIGQTTFDVEVRMKNYTKININVLNQLFMNSSLQQFPWMQIKQPLDKIFNCRKPYHECSLQYFQLGAFKARNLFVPHFSSRFSDMTAVFEHDLREFFLIFSVPESGLPSVYRLVLSYTNISEIVCSKSNSGLWELYLVLKYPAKIERVEANRFQSGTSSTSQISYKTRWQRYSTFPGLTKEVLGSSNVLCFSLGYNESNTLEIAGRLSRSSKTELFFAPIELTVPIVSAAVPVSRNETISTDFSCQFNWEALISRGFQVTDRIDTAFKTHVARSASMNSQATAAALGTMTGLVDDGYWLQFERCFSMLYAFHVKNPQSLQKEMYPGCRYVRRLILTPTRKLLLQPEIMQENRVLRQFGEEYALRVCIRDDNFMLLNGGFGSIDPALFTKAVQETLLPGQQIGGRRYEFLAWSNSQLREHGCWLYAIDKNGYTSEHIRAWMGDFSSIRVVPKFMARMGQCFSQTEDTKIALTGEYDVQIEPDIERGYDRCSKEPYTFSDGIGRISVNLAKKVCDALKISPTPPRSAYQVRYKGCKGLLAVDPTLKPNQIVFRTSQQKFQCQSSEVLEVAKTSQPGSLSLNRPLITILDHLRYWQDVKDHRSIFHELQEKMLLTLSNMLIYEDVAEEQLKLRTSLSWLPYAKLHGSDIRFTTEPFFRRMLLAIHKKYIVNLEMKGRIEIPEKFARNMFGVLDETATLQYGQVFVQYSKIGEPMKDIQMLKGTVMVTKNPCMHPGDVRLFQAIDVLALHHMVDVLVFPQRGPRPHPNEMAGSDLDGDEYSVIWMPQLMFRHNETPMDFPKATVSETVGQIQVSDMVSFMQKYISNDRLKQIATAHLAFADLKGLTSGVCESLQKKHSSAVDFPKTGMCPALERGEIPENRPDFMARTRNSYWSKKVLGQLYRKAHRVKTLSQYGNEYSIVTSVDDDLKSGRDNQYLGKAFEARDAYNRQLQTLMSQYGVKDEGAVISGNIVRLHPRFGYHEDLFEAEKILKLRLKHLWKETRTEFFEEFEIDDDESAEDENKLKQMHLKAAAWYTVTYDQHVHPPNLSGLLSFPWVVSDILAKLKLFCKTFKRGAAAVAQISIPPLTTTVLAYSPLCDDLGKKISEYTDFRHHIYVSPSAKLHEYISAYPGFQQLIQVLIDWAADKADFRVHIYVARLILNVCINKLVVLPYKELMKVRMIPDEIGFLDDNRLGYACMQVLQYFASQEFRNNEKSHQSYRGNMRIKREDKLRMHMEAFNLFYTIPTSREFGHLFRDFGSQSLPDQPSLYMGELEPPLELNGNLFAGHETGQVEQVLQTAAGMNSVEIRVKLQGTRLVWWIIGGYGSVEARENLKHILQDEASLRAVLTSGMRSKTTHMYMTYDEDETPMETEAVETEQLEDLIDFSDFIVN